MTEYLSILTILYIIDYLSYDKVLHLIVHYYNMTENSSNLMLYY